MSDVKEFETRPADDSKAESPLAWSLHEQKSLPHASNPGVILSEKPFLGHLILRGGAIVMDEAVREVMGMALPARPLALVSDDSGERSIQWLSPDEWLVIVPGGEEFALEQKLRQSLGQSHFSIVNVGGGQTVLSLKGKASRDVLMKSISYDVHEEVFPVGKGVSTVFAKATVILRRPEEDGWELVIRRSFADYCYRWLLDAAKEYGVSVTR
ncbi:sarcosine oxidase subunit gamma [Kushneria phyllosphaerae]|uniref:Sarcosine oxidase subunit gamma n=1 Tax=Kushneria phyllosphaerae TaxID=2100822 RepID=A0A2R8CJ33_9GAMM|nr:sarcosine oxidase subunit gamma family protein [Kushneria phyllosphaerae]SPJ32883.1 Sarcosine oxidase subunit gamma [Kushneria phyllosphaerae]